MSHEFSAPKPVAAVVTEWRTNSHADVILSRLLEPEAWGHARPFGLKLAAVYADQFPQKDLCRSYCRKHGVPIFPTIAGAVGVGTRGVPVEGVLIIGEHGDYPENREGADALPEASPVRGGRQRLPCARASGAGLQRQAPLLRLAVRPLDVRPRPA